MDGPSCMFGGIPMQARVYQLCQTDDHDTPTVSVLHESYYECKIYLGLHSHLACTDDPKNQKNWAGEGGLAVAGSLIFVAFVIYMTAGAYANHKRGVEGYARVPNHAFWKSMPGLVVDGMEYTKGSVLVAMNSRKKNYGTSDQQFP